jgi:hypothetical protein
MNATLLEVLQNAKTPHLISMLACQGLLLGRSRLALHLVDRSQEKTRKEKQSERRLAKRYCFYLLFWLNEVLKIAGADSNHTGRDDSKCRILIDITALQLDSIKHCE